MMLICAHCHSHCSDLGAAALDELLLELLRKLDDRRSFGLVQIVRAKDRISLNFDACESASGYRDVLLNLRLPVDRPVNFTMVVELQLHLVSFCSVEWLATVYLECAQLPTQAPTRHRMVSSRSRKTVATDTTRLPVHST